MTTSPATGKRKRGHTSSTKPTVVSSGLDYFVDATQPQEAPAGQFLSQSAISDIAPSSYPDPKAPWSEEQCRRELSRKKIKITVLEDWKQHGWKRGRSVHAPSSKKAQLHPQPLQSFHELAPRFKISRRLLQNIDAQGYTVPTEVQLAAMPLLLDRTSGPPDLLSVAPTGSGKTLAFLLPVMDYVMRKRSKGTDLVDPRQLADVSVDDGPAVLILAPTKELAAQILNEGRKLAQHTGIRISMMKKGMTVIDPISLRSSEVEASVDGESLLDEHSELDASSQPGAAGQRVKAHLLVSTPLMLLHSITRADGTVHPMAAVQHLVLDEADVLLDPLFREQVVSVWNACIHLDLRVSMWSATMGSNIEALARDTIAARHTTLTLTEGSSSTVPLVRLVIGLKDSALPNVSHKLIYAATEAGKLTAVRQLLRPTAASSQAGDDPLLDNDVNILQPPFLIFTQTVPRANALAAELKYDIPPSAGGPSRIAALHANMSDSARDEIMTGFRKGDIWVLVTTDLLARGVDFRGVNGVINYDVPTSAASYVHRAGRTGRAGREGGLAITLYADEDVPFLKPVANVIAMSEGVPGSKSSQGWLLNSLPTPTKREKKTLKKRGIEQRRPGMEKTRISTKSGLDRRVQRRRRDAQVAAARRGGTQVLQEGFSGFEE